jgi:hypothetical protein
MKEFRINMSDEPGSLAELCETIASKDVNILTIVAISGESASAAILTDNADATSAALDGMDAEYSVADLKSGNSGVNLTSLYVMSIDGDSATIGYTTD